MSREEIISQPPTTFLTNFLPGPLAVNPLNKPPKPALRLIVLVLLFDLRLEIGDGRIE